MTLHYFFPHLPGMLATVERLHTGIRVCRSIPNTDLLIVEESDCFEEFPPSELSLEINGYSMAIENGDTIICDGYRISVADDGVSIAKEELPCSS